MSVLKFLDTNILLYGYDRDAGIKREVALAQMQLGWQQIGSLAISVQVLQEFYVNFVRSQGSHPEASTIIEDLRLWPVIDNTQTLFALGLTIKERYDLSLWDAMIVAAARTSGAGELLTEDLNHGQDYGGVRVVNPFI